MNKPTDDAANLKNKVDKYVFDGKLKKIRLKNERDALEANAQTAYKKLNEAKEAKKKIQGKLDKLSVKKQINIGERLKSAFGAVSKNVSHALKDFGKKNGISNAGVYSTNSVFEKLTLTRTVKSASASTTTNVAPEKESITFDTMLTGKEKVFAPPPMVSFSKSKNLVITEIDGTDAEVVERYGDKNWEIKLQGVIIDMKNHQYPEAGVIKLREFFNTSDALEVTSDIFAGLDIKSIYFTNVEIGGVSGFADTIQYTLSARSIQPIEFTFKQNN